MSDEDGPEPTQGHYERLSDFRHVLRRFTQFSAVAAQDAGLTTHQHQALLAIKGHVMGSDAVPIGVGELAVRLLIAPHAAAELVVCLHAAGMVETLALTSDRRRVGLALTTKAEAPLRELTQTHLREVRELAPRLMTILEDLGPRRTERQRGRCALT